MPLFIKPMKANNGKGWAVSTVMTRQNAIPKGLVGVEPVPTLPALIPFWDMANHQEGLITTTYNTQSQQIESTAMTDFKRDEQIFIYYGQRNNRDFLVHNGFVYSNNLFDSVPIRLGLSSSDALVSVRSDLLNEIEIYKNCELDVLPAPNYISQKLLAFARVFSMDEGQLNHWKEKDRAKDLLHIDCALDNAIETKVWSFLKIRLGILLKAFPTTLEHDAQLLEKHLKGQSKLHQINATLVAFRVSEKKILTEALSYVEQKMKA